MKTIVITGGASGLGKGLSLHYLNKGERVVAIGSSVNSGDTFLADAKQIGAEDRAVFLQADLGLVQENRRIADEVLSKFHTVDTLIFCATKHNQSYTETAEGLESSFALDYLSRFILSYGLKGALEKTHEPIIINICGTGMKGEVNWDDLQHKKNFKAQKVMMHGSRLNDLSAVAFIQNDEIKKIKHLLCNSMAVKTPGMMGVAGSAMKLVYKLIGKSIEDAVLLITTLIDSPPTDALSAYREKKHLSLGMPTYSKENAQRLYTTTLDLLTTL